MINTNYLEDNGISTFIIGNCKLLTKEGITMSIVAPNYVDSEIKRDLSKSGIKLYEIPLRFSHPVKYFYRLFVTIKKGNFDIVHVNGNSGSMLLEIMASCLAGVKVRIAHSHNTKTSHPLLNNIMNPFLELLVTQRFACNNAAGKWLFGNREFWVIKNGLDLEKYRYKKETKGEENKIILGNVGRFNYQKNQGFLIDLIKQLNSRFNMLLIGNGDNFDSLRKKVNESNLDGKVKFTGTVNNVCDYLNKMDIFLLPSRFEGQPYSVIEALANGLPILISNTVSREIKLTGHMAFISIDKPDKWQEKLEKFDYRKYRMKRVKISSENIRVLKEKGYDLKTNAKNMLKLYNKFIQI